MIIAINGRIGSGKDLITNIIQYLTAKEPFNFTLQEFLTTRADFQNNQNCTWQNKKFAGKLKEIVCILLGCTLQQLENREFKEKELGEEWWYYQLYGREDHLSYLENKDEYDFDDLYKPTVRSILQDVGTNLFRYKLHEDVWVNALMSEYIARSPYPAFKRVNGEMTRKDKFYPNWIISDMRFPNEMKAVKDRCGITIRVNRFQESDIVIYNNKKYTIIHIKGDNVLLEGSENEIIDTWVENIKLYKSNEHESEKAFDNAEFDYVIYNTGTVENLVEKVKQILTKEHIL